MTLDVPSRFLRWRSAVKHLLHKLDLCLSAIGEMMSCDLIGRFKAEHLEKPPTKSKTPKTPQKGQTAVVVGMPGAPCLATRRLDVKKRGKATVAALSTRLWPRDVIGRGARLQ